MFKRIARSLLTGVSNSRLHIFFLSRLKPRLRGLDKPRKGVGRIYFHPGKYISLLSRFNKSNAEVFKLTGFLFLRQFRMRLNINEYTQCGYFFGFLDDNLISMIKKGGGVFVDIGSNVGMYSLLASQVFDKLFAFEPSKYTFRLLEENIKLNDDIVNITTVNKALSDQVGTVNLHHNPLNNGGASLASHADSSKKAHSDYNWNIVEEVSMDTIDSLFSGMNVGDIDLMKIDVEGHEISTIKGASETIKRHNPALYVEVSGDREKTIEIYNLLPPGYYAYLPDDRKKISIEDYHIPSDILFVHESKRKLIL